MTSSTQSRTELYAEVQQFYARQMQLLDGGVFEAYADTFTIDGEFRHTPGREPARGREQIVRELHEFHERFAGDPVQRRHWFNHVNLEPQEDGTIRSTVYALVVTVRPGVKQPIIAPSCVVHDVLVREDGELLNRSRRVEHDQLF
ncbi:hypothetical protein Acy02nite_77880 [Actinoplanes cyaneus]|uniref:SnoaL-like domain-containing protein n=1 Tax=Actinoplanes cyaneus TaxID=52696 RepID=A0A919M8K2_9ACTN|nr:nuclear transport factor 2 family protein [Actinoplanes cyaneus]MCW2139752.1 actinorhodin biosynthesis protein ActVIA [Actinoplanes cyaneus]GID69907.1 hypothetical protein Acy02nite_77880 [Actinoplanes cyaneus]